MRRRFLGLLGGFREPRLQERALRYVLEGPLRSEELFTIPFGVTETEAGHDRVVDWTLENFGSITERIPEEDVARLAFLGGGCSMPRFERVSDFLSEPSRSVPGTEVNITRVHDQVQDCVRLHETEGDAVADYLKTFAERSES